MLADKQFTDLKSREYQTTAIKLCSLSDLEYQPFWQPDRDYTLY